MKKIIWVVVNCNNTREADNIGRAVLERRLVSCYDIIPRLKAAYFWPPKTGKIESSKGVILLLETLPRKYKEISKKAHKLHSDKLPFIGCVTVEKVSEKYYKWVRGELRKK